MDQSNFNTLEPIHERGKHLTEFERGMIQTHLENDLSIRETARRIGCSPQTICNEIKRGLKEPQKPKAPGRTKTPGRPSKYNSKRAHKKYLKNRTRCRKPRKIYQCTAFIKQVLRLFKEFNWRFDACVGYLRLKGTFTADEMLCTKTLYNELGKEDFPFDIFELPEALKRRKRHSYVRKNKRILGTSIDQRPQKSVLTQEAGHWEGDTVNGQKGKEDHSVLTLVEMKTHQYISIKISDKSSQSVLEAMTSLKDFYGERFSEVFKTITVDNGTEFTDFAQLEQWGTKVYFAHPYSSWERAQNERHNRIFREFVPKGRPICSYSADYILEASDRMNATPRKSLDYHTPEELFDQFLDQVYSTAA